MKTWIHKRTDLLLVFLAAVWALSACAADPAGLAQPGPTPLPTLADSGAVSAEGRVLPLRSTTLGFLSSGKLGEILVAEGQPVRQGDALARLDGLESLEAALAASRFEQVSAQQALDDLNASSVVLRTQRAQAVAEAEKALLDAQRVLYDLDTDAFQDELDERNDAVQDAQEDLEDAQKELDEHKDLDPEDDLRESAQEDYDEARKTYDDAVNDRDTWQNNLDRAQAAVDLAQARLDEARQAYEAVQEGPDPDDLALAQARVDNALAQGTAAQSALDNAVLAAPYDGVVVQVNDLEAGELVTPGTMVVILGDYSAWMIETRDLTEWDVAKVAVGQKVSVTLDALPDLELAGVVESVDQLFTESRGEILYTVHARLEEVDPRLRWGMTALITFEPPEE